MPVELVVPAVGESITEVQVGEWLKGEGEQVSLDDPLVEIESDKATLEVVAPISGTVTQIVKKKGEKASVGDVIGYMEKSAGQAVASEPRRAPQPAPAPEPPPAEPVPPPAQEPRVMPSARRLLEEQSLAPSDVQATGPGGRLLKEDVLQGNNRPTPAPAPSPAEPQPPPSPARQEDAVPMSPMRATIARRLVEAQQTAALLTTFNEIDMTEVGALRQQYQETFQQRYGVKLGFMSFFVKAAIDALKLYPQVNAEVREETIVYRNYYDIGIAMGGGKGLVVPILRSAERMSFAEVEQAIGEFSRRAQENRIEVSELKGGTFSISNGGIYGSMLSTPIVNPPQSGILGLHAIQDRPAVVEGQVVVRPMMYVALTYDHRVVDGREAVGFLKRVKECIENPSRMLVEI